jgi:hypothetical protein
MTTIKLRAAEATGRGPTCDLTIDVQEDHLMLHLQRPGVGPAQSASVFVQWHSNGWEVVVHEAGEAAPKVTLMLPDDGRINIESQDAEDEAG